MGISASSLRVMDGWDTIKLYSSLLKFCKVASIGHDKREGHSQTTLVTTAPTFRNPFSVRKRVSGLDG
jgi:hypothetical protein